MPCCRARSSSAPACELLTQSRRVKVHSMMILARYQIAALRFMAAGPLEIHAFSSIGNVEEVAGMQMIAREFNLSETVFVMRTQAARRGRVRIFTPKAEIPFAGHPTIGTAVLLGALGSPKHRDVVLEEAIGDVRCSVEPLDG